MTHDPIPQFRSALIGRNIIPPERIEADGNLHRCDVDGKNGKNDGAYVLHANGVAAGGFQNHQDGLGWEDWRIDLGRALTPAEDAARRTAIKAIREQRDQDDASRREAAASQARAEWEKAKPATVEHPYCKRKGVKPHGVRVADGDLLVPLQLPGKGLRSLQRIDRDGNKRFLSGGQVRGCYYLIGRPEGEICVVEGFATGASVREATGKAVAVAFDCGNLLPVVQVLREKYPGARIIVCADDDAATAGNPGRTRATEAAEAVGGVVAVPAFGNDRPEGASDFNDLHRLQGLDAVRRCIDEALAQHGDDDHVDTHRNAPRPDEACLYGLIGDIARAGAETTEANPFAIALNAMVYLSAAFGRGCFLPVGNTWHHARLFCLHAGRTGRGRKGDAASLIHRIDKAVRALDESIAPQVHRGGLSSREGLAFLIHDGFNEGKNEVPPIEDKRLAVFESEFANVIAQGKRDGNTLSAALRDGWDGVSIRPATKTNRTWATDPHIALAGAITPGELRSMLSARDLTNGFANRFLIIWAERTQILPFPKATPQEKVDELAQRIIKALEGAGADRFVEKDAHRVTLSDPAKRLYAQLYLHELNDQSAGETVNALIERRAPMLLRMAMLFALCDGQLLVDVPHLNAALAWVRYWVESVKFIFASAVDEAGVIETNQTAEKIVEFLTAKGKATRTDLTRDCFKGHVSKEKIDAALDELLSATPPRIVVEAVARENGPGAGTKWYRMAANSAKSAKSEQRRGFAGDSQVGEVCEASELSPSTVRTVRTVRETANQPQTRANADDSLNSHVSQAGPDAVAAAAGEEEL